MSKYLFTKGRRNSFVSFLCEQTGLKPPLVPLLVGGTCRLDVSTMQTRTLMLTCLSVGKEGTVLISVSQAGG